MASTKKKTDDAKTTEATESVADTEPAPAPPTRDEKLAALLVACEKRAHGPSLDELREAMKEPTP